MKHLKYGLLFFLVAACMIGCNKKELKLADDTWWPEGEGESDYSDDCF